jgi:hypothetical protein
MDKQKSICLNMIVRDESHIIEKTLENLCSYIKFDYWVICDTGSVDNTIYIITEFFANKKIPGEIVNHTWRDFGYNRTLALDAAFNKTDYLLIFDADDSISGNFQLPILTRDKYNLFFGNNDLKYVRPLIINNRKKWKFRGILHEFLESLENVKDDVTIGGNYYIISGKEGARSKKSNKYVKDANLLKIKIDLIESSNKSDIEDSDLLQRYTFYCANSFKDCNDIHNAILYYKKVLEYDTWIQEKYVSALNIGDLYNKLNDIENALLYWYRAISYDKERRESVVRIMDYYYSTSNWFAIYCLHEQIKDFQIKDITSKLFCFTSNVHHNHYLNSIAAANISEWMSGYYSCKYLILNDVNIDITLFNFKCYVYNIHLDPDNGPFIDKLFILFKKYYDSKKELIEHLWNIMSKYLKEKYNLDNISQIINKENDLIVKSKSQNKITIQEASNKILIYTGFMSSLWNTSTLKTEALGGSEKAVIYLSRCFPKNYEIYISGDNLEEEIENIKYINRKNLQQLLNKEKFHTIIISRYVSFFEEYRDYKCFQLVLYAHDTAFLSYPLKSADNILNNIINDTDYVMCLTEWHKNILIKHHDIIKDAKFEIINNGIDLSYFSSDKLNYIPKIKNKFVWSSCSKRGLHILLELWPKILEKMPKATLDICSYEIFPNDDADLDMKKIIDKYDSIIHHGKLNTNKLYSLLKSAEYWLYTNTFPETSCITAMEMLINGVICIYYPNAGLAETIGDYGIKVSNGNEIDVILNLNSIVNKQLKKDIRRLGKEYAMSCSWENRAKKWSTLLRFNEKKKWIFLCAIHMDRRMIEDYINNLNHLYTDYDISLISDTEIFSQKSPSKITFTCSHFDDNILKQFPNTEFGLLNLEPLNITIRINSVLTKMYNHPGIQYYDYSKSNISILMEYISCEQIYTNVKTPIYLPYITSNDELKLLRNFKNNSPKEYDFGIIHDWKNGAVTIRKITPPRRNKVVQFLIKNEFKINIISGWGDDRDSELGKCKIILNIHGQITEKEDSPSNETSNIFEHIRCNRLLDSGYNILSETSYKLDEVFINKYSNLKIIKYEDFFDLNILNLALK